MIYPGMPPEWDFFSLGRMLVSGFFALIFFVVVVGVLVLLVRFLLVATKAARLYVEKNTPVHKNPEPAPVPQEEPIVPPAPDESAPSLDDPAPAVGDSVGDDDLTKPLPKSREPKPPKKP